MRYAFEQKITDAGAMENMNRAIQNLESATQFQPWWIMRGEWDGIAAMDDLLAFFNRLPNPDKQFKVMPGISHASFQQKNYLMVYHMLYHFLSQPEPMYQG